MKQKLKYTELTTDEKADVERFIFLSKESGIQVGVSIDQTSVVLINKDGKIEASIPISDFSDQGR
jgi:hypothetical protein